MNSSVVEREEEARMDLIPHFRHAGPSSPQRSPSNLIRPRPTRPRPSIVIILELLKGRSKGNVFADGGDFDSGGASCC